MDSNDNQRSFLPACSSPRIVILSGGKRGRKSLQELHDAGCHISGVVLQDQSIDNEALCASIGITPYRLLPTDKMSDPRISEFIEGARPDLIILAGCTRIIPRNILRLAGIAVLNLHAGKLPEYRGASVMLWQVINGEPEGVCTIHVVDEGIDTGPIVAQESFPIGPDTTGGEVQERILAIFPRLLSQVVKNITQGNARLVYQDEERATYYSKIGPDDGGINWDLMRASEVHNLVRALNGPVVPSGPVLLRAFTHLNGARIKIHRASVPERRVIGMPGRVLLTCPEGAFVMCSDRAILVSHADILLQKGQRLGSSITTA